MPIYFTLSITGRSFLERLKQILKTYSKRAPFYIAPSYRNLAFRPELVGPLCRYSRSSSWDY